MAGVLYFGPNGASSRMAGIEEKVEALGKALVIERTRNRDLSIRLEEIEARVAAEPAPEPSANSSLNQ